jgi:putative tryptophan/tyrosine transport system substrate-binding protein
LCDCGAVAAFRAALAQLGWAEGNNFRIEVRWGAGNADMMKALSKELVELRSDAILARGTPATRALAQETRIIPIVFVAVADPIGSGFAASLARPGGNITGFSNLFSPLAAKWVALLKEIAPRTERVALLFNPTTLAPLQLFMPSIQSSASALGIEVIANPVHAKEEIEGVIASQARNPGGSLIVMPDGFNLVHRELIVSLASRYSIPAIYFNAAYYAQSGGLITYGPDFTQYYRQAAGYIDRILQAKPCASMPNLASATAAASISDAANM